MGRRRRAPERTAAEVDTGTARLERDPGRSGAYTLLIDGAAQSHVDLDDPAHLEFEYVRRMATAVDVLVPVHRPVRILHLGGGAMTLPRYFATTRPGCVQRVVEVDAPLVDLVRRALPWPDRFRLKVRVGDARAVLTTMPDARWDVIIADVFAGARTPAHLTSVQFIAEAARTLRPHGCYLANIGDGPPLAHTRAQVSTVRAVLPHACVIADAAVLRGRRFGNLVLLAGRVRPPLAELTRRAAGDWFPARVVAGADLDRFAAGAAVVTDADAHPSPAPPAPRGGADRDGADRDGTVSW